MVERDLLLDTGGLRVGVQDTIGSPVNRGEKLPSTTPSSPGIGLDSEMITKPNSLNVGHSLLHLPQEIQLLSPTHPFHQSYSL